MYLVPLRELWPSMESSKGRGDNAGSVPPASKQKWELYFSEQWPVKSKNKTENKHSARGWISYLMILPRKQEGDPQHVDTGRDS